MPLFFFSILPEIFIDFVIRLFITAKGGKKTMFKVLVACEESQRVTLYLRER